MNRRKPNTWETKKGAVRWLEPKPRGPADSERKKKGRDSYSKHKRLMKFYAAVERGEYFWVTPKDPRKLGYWMKTEDLEI